MKASELVKQLLEHIEERGDCDVVAVDYIDADNERDIYPVGYNMVTDKILIRIDN